MVATVQLANRPAAGKTAKGEGDHMNEQAVRRQLRPTMVVVLLLLGTIVAFGQARSSRVTVQVHPEMQLTQKFASVQLAVRLAPLTQAQVWRAEACDATPTSVLLIAKSGRTQIAVETLGRGRKVCAVSTDGALKQSLDLAPVN
jgi:hypothetical protein